MFQKTEIWEWNANDVPEYKDSWNCYSDIEQGGEYKDSCNCYDDVDQGSYMKHWL